MVQHHPGQRTNWLNSKRVLAIGQVMCENLVMRKFFLEKFPNCFVNEGIKFFGDYSEGKEEIIITKIRAVMDGNLDKEAAKSLLKQIESEYIKKMKLPSSRLFCPKRYELPSKDSDADGAKELSRMFEEVLLASTQMINVGFDIPRLVELGVLEKEKSIYYCKTDKRVKIDSCCDKCEEYPLYSFDKTTRYNWSVYPEIFIEALCSYVLQKNFGNGGVFCGYEWWDNSIDGFRELDFVGRDKKWAVLCSKGNINVGNERDQISLCRDFVGKVIFVSKGPKANDSSLLFVGNILKEEHFKEVLIEKI